ncbi:hypothetical protein BDF19DRAFT_13577 [Syncephalis fuscata]|nr:hypothetical protein BDF19DRAFT_13577 [Syncephalis fuscata]
MIQMTKVTINILNLYARHGVPLFNYRCSFFLPFLHLFSSQQTALSTSYSLDIATLIAMSVHASESSPSIISFGHDWGLPSTVANSTANTSSSNNGSVDKVTHNRSYSQSTSNTAVNTTENNTSTSTTKPFSTGIPADILSSSIYEDSHQTPTSAVAYTDVSSPAIFLKNSTDSNLSTSLIDPTQANRHIKMASPSNNKNKKDKATPPAEVLSSKSEFPPLPTQEDAPPPSPPNLAESESYAQAAKHSMGSESEENDTDRPQKPRKRSRSHLSSPSSPSSQILAAKTWLGVGLVAAVMGKILQNKSNHQAGKPLLIGGVATALLSGLSWVWLRRSSDRNVKRSS